MSTIFKAINETDVDAIRKEMQVLASIEPSMLGPQARQARKERLQALAFRMSQAIGQ